ncbi:hypothetical protein PINS_up003920 [Pythium insidiosum]|nr:hypothetical protein PINS_up003920 [Pythium insidiosum]
MAQHDDAPVVHSRTAAVDLDSDSVGAPNAAAAAAAAGRRRRLDMETPAAASLLRGDSDSSRVAFGSAVDDTVVGESCSTPPPSPFKPRASAVPSRRHIESIELAGRPAKRQKSWGLCDSIPTPAPAPALASAICNRVGDENTPPQTQFGQTHEVTAFEEYHDGDIDDLDIPPSQDFANDIVCSPARHGAQRNVPSNWVDFHDGTQFQEEASEVFDNVIYEPPTTSLLSDLAAPNSSSSLQHAANLNSHKKSLHRFTADASSSKPRHVDNDSGSELSDGFDVAPTTAPEVAATDPNDHSNAASSPPASHATVARMTSPVWVERRSVKRDNTFVASPPRRRRAHIEELPADLSESSEEFEEKLKLDDTAVAPSPGEPAMSSPRHHGLSSPSGSSSPFLARRSRKRRKVRQLALDGFFLPRAPSQKQQRLLLN